MKFTKMQGIGNDYIYVNCFEEKIENINTVAKMVSDRHFGIGADGLIIPLLNPDSDNADLGWYFYNSDGTTAQMCGNGMRCFAKYVFDKKIIDKKEFSVQTLAGIIKPQIIDENLIKVNMGTPILEEKKIPFWGDKKEITILDRTFKIFPVSMGNPHCVIFTEDDPMELAEKFGPYVEKHEFFPEKTNTEFVKVISKHEIDMRVYERGCGITLACGTGACASVVACVLNNLTEQKVKVNLLGGPVFVEWQGNKENLDKDIFLIGSANYSFFGEYVL